MDLVYTIPAAIGLGALHSLEPGHGKGVILFFTAYFRFRNFCHLTNRSSISYFINPTIQIIIIPNINTNPYDLKEIFIFIYLNFSMQY